MARGNRSATAAIVGDGGASVGSDGIIVIDPVAAIGPGDDAGSADGNSGSDGNPTTEKPRRKYTKRATSTAKSGEVLSIASIAIAIQGIHSGLAAATGNEIWKVDEEDAKRLSTCIANVARHYDLQQTQKGIDVFNLLTCLGAVYGPRVYMTMAAKKAAREKKPDEQTVYTFPGGRG